MFLDLNSGTEFMLYIDLVLSQNMWWHYPPLPCIVFLSAEGHILITERLDYFRPFPPVLWIADSDMLESNVIFIVIFIHA